ncbi:DUF1146 family protein [Gemelliphila asaccharolytica]|uniref:DUF1146 family protein n=1 Tax=Gemelliphila asaccharolytica TaxID=502393 RepID=UPI000824D845|nr:DUF1146 family protein [Gemella asaccharolytica]
MKVIKLFLLFVIIILVNKIIIKIDFQKIFKKNSNREIFFLYMILSIIIGYLFYLSILEIYQLSIF